METKTNIVVMVGKSQQYFTSPRWVKDCIQQCNELGFIKCLDADGIVHRINAKYILEMYDINQKAITAALSL